MREYERAREQIADIIRESDGDNKLTYGDVADQILSLGDICVKTDDQSLPELPEPSGSTGEGTSSLVKSNQERLIREIKWRYDKAGFVKIVQTRENR